MATEVGGTENLQGYRRRIETKVLCFEYVPLSVGSGTSRRTPVRIYRQRYLCTLQTLVNRYREQLDKIGFSFDWDREIRTCDPEYYHWTQWAFQKMFNSFYCNTCGKAQPIEKLIAHFEEKGTEGLDEKLIAHFEEKGTEGLDVACSEELTFTADEWKAMSEKQQQETLMNYRIAYLGETMVNWCPQLGTVLANDEVVDGVSERGGYPVVQKKMRQWCLRVSAYAGRLLDGLDTIDWTDSLKETQRNWIGRSENPTQLDRPLGRYGSAVQGKG